MPNYLLVESSLGHQLSMIFSFQARCTAMTLPGLASMLMLHRAVGAAALPLKTVREVGATRDLDKGFGRVSQGRTLGSDMRLRNRCRDRDPQNGHRNSL